MSVPLPAGQLPTALSPFAEATANRSEQWPNWLSSVAAVSTVIVVAIAPGAVHRIVASVARNGHECHRRIRSPLVTTSSRS